jgi:chromosome segregation ATPase
MALESGNPFDKLIEEIDAMVVLIAEEEKADDEQKAWCDGEREENHAQLDDKTTNKESLEGKVVELTDTIENAETGLKKQLTDENDKLAQNRKDQADEIETRGLENAAYQANIVNLVNAEKTLDKALKVLKKFYDWLHKKSGPHHYEKKAGKDSGGSKLKRIPEASVEEMEEACSDEPGCAAFNTQGWMLGAIDPEDKWYKADGDLYVKVYDEENPVGLIQSKEDPAPPDAEFSESGASKGGDAVSMLGFILEETKKEEKTAHSDEEEAQKTFEDTMNDLKTQEAACLETIADLNENLASTEKTLEETKIDLEKTTKEKIAIEKYLLKIKPGCDFITENIDTRKDNRAAETDALNTAKDKLMGTPAYKSAAAAVEKAMLGKCADDCGDKSSVECKACVAGTSVTGYCAAHKGEAGC